MGGKQIKKSLRKARTSPNRRTGDRKGAENCLKVHRGLPKRDVYPSGGRVSAGTGFLAQGECRSKKIGNGGQHGNVTGQK